VGLSLKSASSNLPARLSIWVSSRDVRLAQTVHLPDGLRRSVLLKIEAVEKGVTKTQAAKTFGMSSLSWCVGLRSKLHSHPIIMEHVLLVYWRKSKSLAQPCSLYSP
jgi:hypothetical protein